MRSSISLRMVVQEKNDIRCNDCIVKQMIEFGEGCYWPSKEGKWEYFLPEVETTTCSYLKKVLRGSSVKDEDKEMFNECEQFLPSIDWAGLRKDEIKVMQALADFVFLSTGIKVDLDTLIEVFQEVRKMKNIRIQSSVVDGNEVLNQFGYERGNYTLFGVIRDVIADAEVSDKTS